MSAGPFAWAPRNDVTVRATEKRGGWVVGCANCWGHALAADWSTALAAANEHAKECR